jgi:hypothetical protein
MARIEGYTPGIKLIGGLAPSGSGDFPLIEAHDILVEGPNKRLDSKLQDIEGKFQGIEGKFQGIDNNFKSVNEEFAELRILIGVGGSLDITVDALVDLVLSKLTRAEEVGF